MGELYCNMYCCILSTWRKSTDQNNENQNTVSDNSNYD